MNKKQKTNLIRIIVTAVLLIGMYIVIESGKVLPEDYLNPWIEILIFLVPYAINQYNIEDEPSVVNYVNVRGAGFIPTGLMKVNKDCVIGWAHTSHSPVRSLVMYYIDRIVDVEKTINMNLFVHPSNAFSMLSVPTAVSVARRVLMPTAHT